MSAALPLKRARVEDHMCHAGTRTKCASMGTRTMCYNGTWRHVLQWHENTRDMIAKHVQQRHVDTRATTALGDMCNNGTWTIQARWCMPNTHDNTSYVYHDCVFHIAWVFGFWALCAPMSVHDCLTWMCVYGLWTYLKSYARRKR